MKLINYYFVSSEIYAQGLYKFIKKNYKYIDAIEIDVAQFIEAIAERNGIKSTQFETFLKKVVDKTFNNEFYKQSSIAISSPELVSEIYMYLAGQEESIEDSFLDFCHYYEIPIFVTGLHSLLKRLSPVFAESFDMDKQVKQHLLDKFHPFYYSLVGEVEEDACLADSLQKCQNIKDQVDLFLIFLNRNNIKASKNNTFNVTQDCTKALEAARKKAEKYLTSQGLGLIEDPPNYLYNDLFGMSNERKPKQGR